MLADILVAQLGTADRSLARGKLAIKDILRYVAVFHPAHVAEPAQPALSEERVHGRKASACEYLGIWHFVTPFDAKDAAKTAQVEAVQLPLLFGVCCPGLTAMQERADDSGVVHCHLSWDCELWILPDTCCKSA